VVFNEIARKEKLTTKKIERLSGWFFIAQWESQGEFIRVN